MLLSHHVYLLNLFGIFCACAAIAVTSFIPKHLGRDVKASKSLESSTNDLLLSDDSGSQEDLFNDVHERPPRTNDITHIILTSWISSFAAVSKLFSIGKPTFTVVLIFGIYSFTTRVEVVGPQYISITLGWSLATVNLLLATKALVSACLLLALPTVRRIYLEPRINDQQIDLLIVQASLFFNAIGAAGVGFPLATSFFVLTIYIYTTGIGVYDSLTTYGRCTLPDGEKMSEFFVRSGLVQTIAGLVAAPIWTTMFSVCLKSEVLPIGLPFWVSAGLFAAIFVISGSLKGQASYSAVAQVE